MNIVSGKLDRLAVELVDDLDAEGGELIHLGEGNGRCPGLFSQPSIACCGVT